MKWVAQTDFQNDEAVGYLADRLHRAAPLPVVRRAVRARQGDLMSAPVTEVPTPRATGFHTLRVADVERLCDDAVAVRFDVPDALRDDYGFRAGQYLTLRLETADGEERRSYSICAPEGAAPRIGVRRVDDGLFSTWLVDRLGAGDEIEVDGTNGTVTIVTKATTTPDTAETPAGVAG